MVALLFWPAVVWTDLLTSDFEQRFGLEFSSTLVEISPKLALSWLKLGLRWPKLAPRWLQVAHSGPSCPQVGRSWPNLVPSWLQVGPNLAQVCPKLGPGWANLGPMLSQVVRRSLELAQVGLERPVCLVCWTLRTLQNHFFFLENQGFC